MSLEPPLSQSTSLRSQALGSRLETVLTEAKGQGEGGGDGRRQADNVPLDDARKRQLRLDDDEEDFLDEGAHRTDLSADNLILSMPYV